MIEVSKTLLFVIVGGVLGYIVLKEIGMIIGIAAGYYLGRHF